MYSIAAIVAASLLSFFAGFTGGWKAQDWRFASKIATIQAEYAKTREELAARAQIAEVKARQTEHDAQVAADMEREKSREKVNSINRQLASALDGLRNRPERTPPSTRGEVPGATCTCTGLSGAELARGDAEFLVRYSSDAAKLSAAVEQCQVQYEQVRALLSKE